ncbi:hypothetical protein H5T54_06430 [Candidatus Bipolaricaulota bacterium]|nr:hypothetical protein [Candidatus Bipolaricaulota bacterium]
MRLKQIGTALVVVALLGVVGFAQAQTTDSPARFTLALTDDEGRFFAGTTDDVARFTCTVDFASITKVTGSLKEDTEVLAAVPLKLMFESRPEVLQILGIGNIGALWVSADGFDWERVPRYTVDWTASGVSIDLGTVVVTPKVSIRCEDITQGIKLYGETGEYVHFVTGTCTAELWYEFDPIIGLRLANKVLELPRQVRPAGTWIVVEKLEKGQVTQTYYQSDGRVWVEKERIVFQRASSLPALANHCEHFLVKGAGGKEYMYHWWQPDPSLPGRWRSLGEWKPVETVEEVPPQDEGGTPGMG